MIDKNQYLTDQQVCEIFPVSITVGTLRKWRVAGIGPEYFKFGRLVRYTPATVEEWLDLQRKRSTSDRKARKADLLQVRTSRQADSKAHRFGAHRRKCDDTASSATPGGSDRAESQSGTASEQAASSESASLRGRSGSLPGVVPYNRVPRGAKHIQADQD